jgi:2-hydroxy-3-oxopropionate reductase
VGAKNATLSIMVGGPAAFERAKPLFELMGKNITLVGGNGRRPDRKVANQIIVALNIKAVAEGLLFAARRGRSGQGAPGADGRLCLLAHPRSAGRAHDQAHLRSGLPHQLHQKDLNLALTARASSAWRCRTPPTRSSCSACVSHGGGLGPLGHGARAGELSNFEIGQKAG